MAEAKSMRAKGRVHIRQDCARPGPHKLVLRKIREYRDFAEFPHYRLDLFVTDLLCHGQTVLKY